MQNEIAAAATDGILSSLEKQNGNSGWCRVERLQRMSNTPRQELKRMKLTRLSASAALLCAISTCAAAAQSQPPAYHGPVVVELLSYLHVRHVQPGSSVFVRVSEDWSGLGCFLRRGAIVEAKVEAAVPHVKGRQESQLALSFSSAQCSGAEMAPIDLVLAAVASTNDTNAMRGQYPIVRYSLVKGAGNGTVLQGNYSMSGIEFGALTQGSPRPKLKPGEVYGIRGLTLHIGAGPGRSSLLSSTSKDVAIEKDTQFVLVPASVAFLPTPFAGSEVSASNASAARAPAPAPASPAPRTAPSQPAEFEACAPPACSVDLPVALKDVTGRPATSITVSSLGYSPRLEKEIDEFDDDSALAWLGPDELLLAFNPHKLIPRSGVAPEDAPVRMIRAVLIDTRTSRVEGTADWELSDSGQFLWQLSGNRVLAHMGNELRVYGAGLKLESRFLLAGRLAFVRASPDGELIAVAVLRERHTQQLHAQLRDSLGQEPEEDVDIRILDKDFKTIAESTSASHLLPPTLLNEGQVNLLAKSKMEYRLSLLPWSGEAISLARFTSSCLPEVSGFAPDLLFVRTCNKADGTEEYRVLRSHGQVLVHGKSDPQELGQEASGNSQSMRFAVKVVHASRAAASGAVFHGADLDSEEVRVYRAEDGKRLAAVRVDAPAPSHGGYALSPDGSVLAVLAGARIGLYPVPADTAK